MDGENGWKKINEPNILEFAETEIFKDVMYFDLLGLSHEYSIKSVLQKSDGPKN